MKKNKQIFLNKLPSDPYTLPTLQQVSDDDTANRRQKCIFQHFLITLRPWKIRILTSEFNMPKLI